MTEFTITYTCPLCKEIFVETWNEEIGVATFHRDFPNEKTAREQLEYICDPCYNKVRKELGAKDDGDTIQ